MIIGSAPVRRASLAGVVALVLAAAYVSAQDRPPVLGRVGPNDRMIVDPLAANRGRSVYAAQCITCHGPNTRGTEEGPNLLRSEVVIRNRVLDTLGPFLKKGHMMQSGASTTTLTEAQMLDLAHFLRQRFEDTLRGSAVFVPGDVLVGNAKAGAEFFNGAGRCTECHSVTGDLKGYGARYDPVTIQFRTIFPMAARGRGARGGGSPRTQSVTTVTLPSGEVITGELVMLDEAYVSVRDSNRVHRTIPRGPGVKIERTQPFAFHIDLLDRITDTQMHDLVAYLETMK